MRSYSDVVAEDRRLVILRILRGVHERRVNQFVLRKVMKLSGYDELLPTVENDIAWLRKQGLVKTEELDGGVVLVILTDFGDQAARGVVRVSGLAVPAE